MTKRWLSISAFTMTWMFAFSMMAACYCAPVAVASEMVTKKCHAPAKAKEDCCKPRLQSDHFENASSTLHFELKAHTQGLSSDTAIKFAPDFFQRGDSNPLVYSSPPPQIYLLHHSFLI